MSNKSKKFRGPEIPLPGDIFYFDQHYANIVEVIAGPFIEMVGCGMAECCSENAYSACYKVLAVESFMDGDTEVSSIKESEWGASLLSHHPDCYYLGRIDDLRRIDMPEPPGGW